MATFDTSYKSSIFYNGKIDGAIPADKNNTDLLAPEFKLYIEGIQVPFSAISISQSYGNKPVASIQIPPQSGLLDITRGYEPKVHIFFRDDNYGGDRLLFWGTIKAASYQLDRQNGSSFISFSCEHKNAVLNQVTLDFGGWAAEAMPNKTDPNENSAIKPSAFNSTSMIIAALEGIVGLSTDANRIIKTNSEIEKAPVNLLDIELIKLQKRFEGMPGIVFNLWNQLKKSALTRKFDSLAMTKMYIPLVEEGISYFKRMSGHTFLEKQLNSSRQPYCVQASKEWKQLIIPPFCKNPIASAVQAEIAAMTISNIANFSGELTSFEELIYRMLGVAEYDVLTLASPAEINIDPDIFVDKVSERGVEKVTVETIIKPQIPFYFSPICNVVLPRLVSDIQINQAESATPTRISATHDARPGQGNGINTSIKGPPTYREATAYAQALHGSSANNLKLDLALTKGPSWFVPSKYEQGSGIRHEKIAIPWWLVILTSDKENQGPTARQEVAPTKSTDAYNSLLAMSAEWKSRYSNYITEEDGIIKVVSDPLKDGLNPYDMLNPSVQPHERILFSKIDYEYTKRITATKNGTVNMVFNPYIIPGYPMDVIAANPNHPSFHGFCTSVTHSITSRSLSTSVSMTNVVTYAELSNYYIPPIAPYLQMALNMVNAEFDQTQYGISQPGDTKPVKSTKSTLIQNQNAKASADQFYRSVLGVGAAAPDDLVHFETNTPYSLERAAGILRPNITPGTTPGVPVAENSAKQSSDYLSVVGNLRLISRPIESKESIEYKFKYFFVDLDPKLYNDSFVNYVNPLLAQDLFLEPGASLFLDYMETKDFIKN